MGISEGGPASIVFAASRPDRVQALVLIGTFAWTPAAAAGALASIEGLLADDGAAIANARAIEAAAHEELDPLVERFEQVGDVRASGALIGVEFVQDRTSLRPAPAFHRAVHLDVLRRGVLGITQWGKWVYRLQPALTMPLDLFRWSCARIAEAIEEVATSPPAEPPSILERGTPTEGRSRRR